MTRVWLEAAERLCLKIAAEQFGLINLAQAAAAGMTRAAIKHRLATGQWERVLPRVYRVTGSPPSWHQDAMAAHLYLGDESVLSFGAAGRVRGWRDFEDDQLELSTTGLRRAVGLGFTVHHCDDYIVEGAERVNSLPVTSVPRTITDLAGAKDWRAQRALDRALRRGTSLGAFWLFHDREWTTGRRGIGILRNWLRERTPGLAATDEDLREDLLVIIRKAGLPEPVQEHPFVLPSGPIRFDLAYPERRLAIEGDGYDAHGDLTAFNKDRRRDVEAGLFGWLVLRYGWAQITFDSDYVADSIREHHALRSPTWT
jgi:hypothetical protein